MLLAEREILSLVRLPVPPLQLETILPTLRPGRQYGVLPKAPLAGGNRDRGGFNPQLNLTSVRGVYMPL
jgi:hypothetical protein